MRGKSNNDFTASRGVREREWTRMSNAVESSIKWSGKMPTGFHNLEITDDQIRIFQSLVNYSKALSSRT